MALNLDDLTPLRTMPKTVPAGHYNDVRLALRRLGNPLRIEMPRLHVEILLCDKVWWCLRHYEDEIPLLAWTAFEARRGGLHDPVSCRLHLYHCHAGLLMGTALDALQERVRERLEARRLEAGR